MMDEPVVRDRRSGPAHAQDTETHSKKWIPLVLFFFGLFCTAQVASIYLRIVLENRTHEITGERDQLKLKLEAIENYGSEGWMYFRGSVYLGSTTVQNWEQSRQFCQDRGADLPIISSVQEQTFVMNTFNGRRWIGLTATRSEPREWRWVDGSQLNTSFWASGEPNNEYNEEFCAETNFRRNINSWNDEDCTDRLLYICQKRLTV